MIEGQPDSNKENYIGDRDPGEDSDPGDRQGRWQPKIVKLVKTFLDSPDIRVSGEIH
jgi:hypothetical protein